MTHAWEGPEGDAPTGVAATELGAAIDATEAVTAWSLDDGDDWEPPRRLTPGRITALAVVGSLVLITTAVLVGFAYLRDSGNPTPAGPPTATSTTATTAGLSTATTTQAPPPPPAPSRPPAPVTLPMDGYGQVHVRTASGKTVCALTAGDVQCNVRFVRPVPSYNTMPASGVSVTSRGEWQWLFGDPGDPDYVTMTYGTVYRALGWTITPTSEGTTFMYDATGHGMTVSVDGFSTF